ncbi:MAG: thiol-activated cytolysin family protein [Treponema sp.]
MLQTKNIGWLTKLHVHTKVLLLLVAMASMGCKQPMKQTDSKQTPQMQKTETDSKKNTKQEGEKQKQKKQEGNKDTTKESGKENAKDDDSEEEAGEITYAGLPIPTHLSKSPESAGEQMVSDRVTGETEPTVSDKGLPVKYLEKKKAYRIAAAFEENLLLDPEKDSIYPGSVLVGSSIDDGTYQEITQGKKRKAVHSFSLSGTKTKSGAAGVITDKFVPNLAAFRDFRNNVLNQKIGYTASISSSYEEIEIKSKSAFDAQFKIGVGFAAAGLKAKIGSGFKFKSGEEKKRYLIRFTETFYTVNINQDSKPLMTDIPKEILGKSMPVYVSSVSYGRLAYLSIETDKEWKDIKPHIDAVLKCKPNDVNADVSAHIEKLNEMTTTNITVIGGGSESATTLAQFRKYIVNGGFSSGNPGQIIKYKLRFLDDDAPAHIKYADSYETVERIPVAAKAIELTAQAKSMDCSIVDYGSTAEFFGSIDMRLSDEENGQGAQDTKATLFKYPREHVLEIPTVGRYVLEKPAETITIPCTTKAINLIFDLRERNYAALGGDRTFFIDHDNKATQDKKNYLIKLPKEYLSETITLYDKTRPQDTVKFTIELKVKYLFN